MHFPRCHFVQSVAQCLACANMNSLPRPFRIKPRNNQKMMLGRHFSDSLNRLADQFPELDDHSFVKANEVITDLLNVLWFWLWILLMLNNNDGGPTLCLVLQIIMYDNLFSVFSEVTDAFHWENYEWLAVIKILFNVTPTLWTALIYIFIFL